MGLDIKKSIEKFSEFLESDEGEEFIRKENEKYLLAEFTQTTRFRKIKEYLEENSLDDLMERLSEEHGDEWTNKCYANGCEPYPNNKLSLLLSYMDVHGFQLSEEDMDDEDFLSSEVIYDNYKISTYHGQGCFQIIHKFDKNVMGWVIFLNL